jgi:hypothetical protein
MSGPSRLACACLLAGAATGAWAQSTAIYTCVDAKGRRLTSDRPITECLDREQRELNPTGTVRRVRPPVPTAVEQAAQDQKNQQLAEERQRAAEQKRVDKLLVARYPDQASHDAERAKALRNVTDPAERQRIGHLFDAERARLQQLWAQRQTAANEAAPVNR